MPAIPSIGNPCTYMALRAISAQGLFALGAFDHLTSPNLHYHPYECNLFG